MPRKQNLWAALGGIFANKTVTVPVGRAAKLLLNGRVPTAGRHFDFRGAAEPEWVFDHEPMPSNYFAAVSPSTASLIRLAESSRPEVETTVEPEIPGTISIYRDNSSNY